MVTANHAMQNASHVYNLGRCFAVLFQQARRGPDLILVALAGRVGNVVQLLRPRTPRSLLCVRDIELSPTYSLASFIRSRSRHYPRWINSLVNISAAGERVTPYVSKTKTQLYIFSWARGLSLVMLYYDYLLTLPREIQFLWPPHNKQGWFTLACFLNRYLPVIGLMPITASYFVSVNPEVRPSSLSFQVGEP
jgi:hypothetical protein